MTDHDTTLEELTRSYYGNGSTPIPSDATLDDLLASYYGRPDTVEMRDERGRRVVLTLSADDGEVLAQRPVDAPPAEEYVVDGTGALELVDEYVVDVAPTRVSPAAAEPAPVAPEPVPTAPAAAPVPTVPPVPESEPDVSAAQERALDVLQPLADAEPVLTATPMSDGTSSYRDDADSTVTEDDFVADMQAILSGQKVYDPTSKRAVEPERLAVSEPASAGVGPTEEVRHAEAIFDRIAKSMSYANAYDLGTVELENRFADFDRIADLRSRPKPPTDRVAPPTAPVVGGDLRVGAAEFAEDLEQIHHRAAPGDDIDHDEPLPTFDSISACGAGSLSVLPSSTPLSRPLFDAGEHVWAGEGIHEERLRVGRQPGVLFSYGHLIAMGGDLYEDVDQLMRADVAELTEVKALLDRSLAFYRGGKRDRSLDVSNERWDKVTKGRYLELAEDNYSHFAPNTLLDDPVSKAADTKLDHQLAWEQYHRRAIEAAQALFLDPQNANRSVFPEWPLVINAFGDHFLTDAFSAGHLINKEVMIAQFKHRFYSNGQLNADGRAFFARVARAAFKGEVKAKFSKLESTSWARWWLPFHPNIHTTERFEELLLTGAQQHPDRVANFVVKALHDRLNREGVPVANDAGDAWLVKGDGHLDDITLGIMQRAVQQSVANLGDPSIRASNLDFRTYFERVWKYTPQPTAESRARLATLVRQYTDPTSTELSNEAAQIIHDQLDSLITTLKKMKKLRDA